MASVYAKPCTDNAKDDVGYQSDGLWNKYAERLDECDFFAGCGKKNGQVDYCAIAVAYWIFMNVILDSGEPTDDDRKYMAHYALYQSDSCCTAAGCTQQSGVYKDNGAWYTDPQDLERGDQIFFQKSNGQIYHTGICVDWDDSGVSVVEANVEGRQTLLRRYAYSDFGNKIAGFGRPRYDGWELETSENPNENDEDVVEPEPISEPENKKYKVCVNSWLNVREGAGKEYPAIWKLRNGDIVTIYEEKDGWGRIDDYGWVCMDYLQSCD